jgi:hypothetical protein
MNKVLTLGAGLGIGTISMYLLDPDRGKRRRALVRDKFLWAQRKTGDCLGITTRDVKNRVRGMVTTVQSRFTSDEVSDTVLIDRVRSKLGRIVSHPRAIEVAAEDGRVTLSGTILEAEVDHLLACVSGIRGVQDVVNKLEAQKDASNHPALQGGRDRQHHRFEFMQENWSPAARLVAGAAGASLAIYGGARRDTLGAGMGTAGLLLLTRGITNKQFSRLVGFGGEQKTEDGRSQTLPESSAVESFDSRHAAL